MGLYTGYNGKGLNHVEVLYQTGERALAIKFATLLGCAVVETPQVTETGSTYICVHPDPDDRDPINNVLYLSEIRPAQRDLEALLRPVLTQDAQLASALQAYRHKAENKPFGIPHFGLRFPTFDSIEPVLQRLDNNRDPDLQGRYTVRVIRPSDTDALVGDLIQAFVYTDIIATGLFPFGQVIELQAQRAPY